MGSLNNKRVLLGVTGGIAAYKSAELIRCLQGEGAEVRVVMTPAATKFITPLTLQALSGNPVSLELLDTAAEAAMGHIELARWADLILVAPASADFIARLCHGEGNDLLSTVCLASHSPIAVAPAMNKHMWENAATQKNLQQLHEQAVHIFGPASGYQACGDVGEGRMESPASLSTMASNLFVSGLL
ncbi:MAG: bifunctional phosphopantothenoylcysteine decarboxylase/phosphopantothenate--cysteine ligase CoaBC, partial [Gammaproteobacteria bacterium]